ncbi:hypothetical protein CHLNCDRAFT_135225 [Chlorella variabilis]|uniref:Uncharacterized protein n=1 Tax=Chlorella variabilis TaxID=554065 RepID=E1ZHS1_CHLVA|nr:hypothetical protein CHLNCDRAFT_135225 [Chlorella variabilis]EFN54511.1 hypothetical protein CHLNCDRAFT_135225 [Chlorella variabilis]|eukprot:XP_005846613.1 hypothetical protein CHLNCDRAFT_135225 [Chlorella variabilis]
MAGLTPRVPAKQSGGRAASEAPPLAPAHADQGHCCVLAPVVPSQDTPRDLWGLRVRKSEVVSLARHAARPGVVIVCRGALPAPPGGQARVVGELAGVAVPAVWGALGGEQHQGAPLRCAARAASDWYAGRGTQESPRASHGILALDVTGDRAALADVFREVGACRWRP